MRYGILVLPKMGSTTLRDKSGTDMELDKVLSSSSKRSVSRYFTLTVVFLPTGVVAISGICPNR